jgi:uncharacterized LabA/DUF88 family protein
MKKKSLKTYVFIDFQNLRLGVEHSRGAKLDFKKFIVYLRDKYKANRVFIFWGFMAKNKKLYEELESYGYELILKPTLRVRNKNTNYRIKGNVDAELVLHSMINYRNYDRAIIVSGDGDFYCLVEYLESKKKLYKIIVPNGKYSSLLRKYAKYITPLNLFLEKVKL